MTNADRMLHLRGFLGWSQFRMGWELGLSGNADAIRERVHLMETGKRDISGPIVRLLEKIAKEHDADFYNPQMWE
jgi:hypothetical protein